MTDYSLRVQEAYYQDFDSKEAEYQEALKDVEYQELVQKSFWISELLKNFKFWKVGKDFFNISLRGLENVDVYQVLEIAKPSQQSSGNSFYFKSNLNESEIVERLAIACYLELEKAIDTKIANQKTDNEPLLF